MAKRYVVARISYTNTKTFFRAYINFIDEEEVYTFTNKFDGYVFVDDRGIKTSFLGLQWGSDILTHLDFEWSERG